MGKRLGQGETIDQIMGTMKEVAEGVPTSLAAVQVCVNVSERERRESWNGKPGIFVFHSLSHIFFPFQLAEKYGLDLPIVKAVASVIEGKVPPMQALQKLMTSPLRPED